MRHGTGPTTAEVDDGLLVHSQILLLAQIAPIRWALSERAILLLPRKNNASSTIEGTIGVPTGTIGVRAKATARCACYNRWW